MGYADRNMARTWVAILEAAGLKDGDMVLVDILTTPAWREGQPGTADLPEPHLHEPVILGLRENRHLQEAVRACKQMTGSLMKNAIIVILLPHARYMGTPCCRDHMNDWQFATSPQILMKKLMEVDQELKNMFHYNFNASYVALKTLATACEGPNMAPGRQ